MSTRSSPPIPIISARHLRLAPFDPISEKLAGVAACGWVHERRQYIVMSTAPLLPAHIAWECLTQCGMQELLTPHGTHCKPPIAHHHMAATACKHPIRGPSAGLLALCLGVTICLSQPAIRLRFSDSM